MNTLLVAEIGINHNGNVKLAHQMIDCAADNGANAIKFQMHLPHEEMVLDLCKNVIGGRDLWNTISQCTLTYDDFLSLQQHCHQRKTQFFATPFSIKAVELLKNMNVDIYKVGSGETNDFLLLNRLRIRREINCGLPTFEYAIPHLGFRGKKNTISISWAVTHQLWKESASIEAFLCNYNKLNKNTKNNY